MNEITTAINRYSTELVAGVLDLLEGAGCNPKLCGSVRQAIYDKRDAFLFKLKTGAHDYDRKFFK